MYRYGYRYRYRYRSGFDVTLALFFSTAKWLAKVVIAMWDEGSYEGWRWEMAGRSHNCD